MPGSPPHRLQAKRWHCPPWGLKGGVSRDPDRAAGWRAGQSREPPPEAPDKTTPPASLHQGGAPSHGSEDAVLQGPCRRGRVGSATA